MRHVQLDLCQIQVCHRFWQPLPLVHSVWQTEVFRGTWYPEWQLVEANRDNECSETARLLGEWDFPKSTVIACSLGKTFAPESCAIASHQLWVVDALWSCKTLSFIGLSPHISACLLTPLAPQPFLHTRELVCQLLMSLPWLPFGLGLWWLWSQLENAKGFTSGHSLISNSSPRFPRLWSHLEIAGWCHLWSAVTVFG